MHVHTYSHKHTHTHTHTCAHNCVYLSIEYITLGTIVKGDVFHVLVGDCILGFTTHQEYGTNITCVCTQAHVHAHTQTNTYTHTHIHILKY